MGLIGILAGLGLLIWLAFRGWSALLLAPALVVAQFFPLFLLGALFGKLMDDSGSVQTIARFMTERLGPHRAILAVVLAGAMVTYGGVSLFVAFFFVLAPMAQSLFQAADIPASADARRHHARNLDVHHVGSAGHTGHSERHSDALL